MRIQLAGTRATHHLANGKASWLAEVEGIGPFRVKRIATRWAEKSRDQPGSGDGKHWMRRPSSNQ
jgi:hypothetical protein